VTVEIPAQEYEILRQIGEGSYRSIEQESAYLIHQAILQVEAEAMTDPPVMNGTLSVELPEEAEGADEGAEMEAETAEA